MALQNILGTMLLANQIAGSAEQRTPIGRRPRGRGTPYRPQRVGTLPAPAMLPPAHISGGIPYGGANLKPSKFSGGFSMIAKSNIIRDRQERQRAAARPQYAPAPLPVGRSSGMMHPALRGMNGLPRKAGANGGTAGELEYQPDGFLAEFLKQADEAQTAANAKNEQRYADILTGHDARLRNAGGTIDQLGATERLAIDDRHKQDRAQADQDLLSRGLGNTTVRSSVMRGYDTERDRALTRLEEDKARLRLQYIPALEGDRLGFMERRDDAAPDPLSYAQLASAVGAAGVGGVPAGSTGSRAKMPETDLMKRRIAELRKRLPAAAAAKLLPKYPV